MILQYWIITLLLIQAVGPGLKAEEIPPIPLSNQTPLNWAGEDYAPQISPDGTHILFQSDRPGSGQSANLWYSTNQKTGLENAEWSAPLPLQFPLTGRPTKTMQVLEKNSEGRFAINTDGFEGMASLIYRGGKPVEIYYTSESHPETGLEGYDGLNIYFSRFRDERWSPPRHLNAINSDFNDRMPIITQDGRRMYFISDRPGGFGRSDIWYSERNLKTGRWSRPLNAGFRWNTEANEIAPGISPDGRLFFFSSDRSGGFGHYDIYYSRFTGFEWEAAENLGEPFNGEWDEEYLSLTGDGIWAYFASDRSQSDARGGFDIYRITVPEWLRTSVDVLFTGLLLDAASREPFGLEATIRIHYEKGTLVVNSRPFYPNSGEEAPNNFAIQLSSQRDYRVTVSAPGYYPQEFILDYTGNIPAGGIDRHVIVMQPIVPELTEPELPHRILPGRVIDARTGLSLPGSTVEYQPSGENPKKAAVDEEGHFHLVIQPGRSFDLQARAPGYRTFLRRFPEIDGKELVIQLEPEEKAGPCPENSPECIDNLRIYFAVDSAVISTVEQEKLQAIARIMRLYPELRIRIEGHTDETHTYDYNQLLSENRAVAVKEALQSHGIESDRLEIHGYSYLRPFIPEKSTKARTLNRRVEFRRIKNQEGSVR